MFKVNMLGTIRLPFVVLPNTNFALFRTKETRPFTILVARKVNHNFKKIFKTPFPLAEVVTRAYYNNSTQLVKAESSGWGSRLSLAEKSLPG